MDRRTPSFRLALCAALLFTFAGGIACGQGLKEPLQSSRESLRELVDDAQQYIEGESLETRRQMCAEENGKWTERLIISVCEEGEANVESEWLAQKLGCGNQTGAIADNVCVHENEDGSIRFNDGPSVPPEVQKLTQIFDETRDQSRYNFVLWEAGRRHDDCYHHSPVATGKSKKQCDEEFLSDMGLLCADAAKTAEPWFRRENCEHYAAVMFMAVDRFGQESFDMVNLEAKLPTFVPLSESLDVDAQDAIARVHKAVETWEGYTP